LGTPHPAEGETNRDPLARVVIGVLVAAVVALAVSRALYPYDMGHYEAVQWAPAELLARGESPWSSGRATTPPFVMAPYGPPYYWLVGVGLVAFGPQFWWGRTLSVLALLLATACLFTLTRRLTGRRDLGMIAVAAFLAQPATQLWVAVQRPDVLALLLGLAGLTLATAARPRVGAIAFCLAGAVLTRQTSVLPYAAAVAWLFVAGRRRAALAVAVLTPGLVGVVTLFFEITSDGGYLWQQFVLPSTLPLNRGQLEIILGILARGPGTWVVLALLPLGLVAATTPPYVALRLILWLYAAAAAAVAALTSARLGSNVNYFLEPSALAAVLAALGAERLARHSSALVPLIALALAGLVGLLPLGREEIVRWRERAAFARIVNALAAAGPSSEPVLTGYPDLAAYAGRTYWFNDGVQYDGRSPAHREYLLQTLRDRVFPAMVLPYDQPPRGYVPTPATPPARHPPAFLFVRR
jgi:4-amino-4-deoxy-L-arabinose transferase-like glycosyltransferase